MSRPGYIDKRGNANDRAVRRSWLLTEFDVDLGPGRARCHLKLSTECERVVDEVTLSVDRIEMGGSYRRSNIQPACKPCQDRQGGLANVRNLDDLLVAYRAAREQWEINFDLETGHTYYPGIVKAEQRKERRGGRREVTDYLDEFPPPTYRDWLAEWHASRREPDEAAS